MIKYLKLPVKCRNYKIKNLVYIISILFLSILDNFSTRHIGVENAFFAVFSHFFGAMVFGYVISMYVRKYKQNDWIDYWKIVYAIMVIVNILAHIL